MIGDREVADHAAKRRIAARQGAGHIAIEASGSGGPGGPVQIDAQVLRDRQASAESSGSLQFVMPQSAHSEEPAEPLWRDADVDRAIAAAERAGLGTYRIEIAPDGTIAIVVGMPETD